MAILFKWLAELNVDTDWTNIETDGTVTYGGSPLTKNFQKAASTSFNNNGHYLTAGYTGAVGLRFVTFVKVSSTTNTDVYISGVVKTATSLGNQRTYYISGSTLYVQMGGGSGVNALASNDPSPLSVDTIYQLEQRVRANGGSDFYVNGLVVLEDPSTEGLNFTSGTLRPYLNLAKCNNFAGFASWTESYVTDTGGFTPPTPNDLEGVAAGQTSIRLFWTQSTLSAPQYTIYINGSPSDSGNWSSDYEPGQEGLVLDTGFSPDTAYDVEVRGVVFVNGVSFESADSNLISVTTDSGGNGDEDAFLILFI